MFSKTCVLLVTAAMLAHGALVPGPSFIFSNPPGARGARVAVLMAQMTTNMPRLRGPVRGTTSVESWYYESFGSTVLLTAKEEIMFGRRCQVGVRLQATRGRLEKQLERSPTREEWAAEAALNSTELNRQLARASHASDAMVVANMRLVLAVVRPFSGSNNLCGGLCVEDLVQEGSLGLLKAVERFDPDRGYRFSTYATWWIRATVQRAVADKSRTIRLVRQTRFDPPSFRPGIGQSRRPTPPQKADGSNWIPPAAA